MSRHSLLVGLIGLTIVQLGASGFIGGRRGRVLVGEEQSQTDPSLDTRKVVHAALVNWVAETKIEITEEAQKEIERGFVDNEGFVRGIVDKRKLSLSDQKQLLSDLVDYYLYDVRDLAIAQQLKKEPKVRNRPTIQTPGINPNVPLPRLIEATYSTDDQGRIVKLEASDFKAFGVAAFFKSIARVFDGGTGRLVVSSHPDNAVIKIDGADKGFTNKNFVVSAGTHKVITDKPSDNLHCEHPVDVPADQTVTFNCP